MSAVLRPRRTDEVLSAIADLLEEHRREIDSDLGLRHLVIDVRLKPWNGGTTLAVRRVSILRESEVEYAG